MMAINAMSKAMDEFLGTVILSVVFYIALDYQRCVGHVPPRPLPGSGRAFKNGCMLSSLAWEFNCNSCTIRYVSCTATSQALLHGITSPWMTSLLCTHTQIEVVPGINASLRSILHTYICLVFHFLSIEDMKFKYL